MIAPVPLLTANGRCGFGEGSFATTRGKGEMRRKRPYEMTRYEMTRC
jgi:hypothetical protein